MIELYKREFQAISLLSAMFGYSLSLRSLAAALEMEMQRYQKPIPILPVIFCASGMVVVIL